MHWADVEAEKLMELETQNRIATGITPSGHIHVGNMREIITGDAAYRAIRERGGEATLFFIADTFDPLRKVYPFLDDSYARYINQPISEIPCPCGEHASYADHFLEPFMRSVKDLGIDPVVKYVPRMYKEGEYYQCIKRIIEEKEKVREILERVSARQLSRDWFPYTPKCSACNTFANTHVKDHSDPYVAYTCTCGNEGKADTRTDEGKLPWRLEWPARWTFLGITCEPFGKDHASAGGSFASGKEIIEKVLGARAPHPIVYEWIQLKGKGAMSSSTGVVVSGVDMLKMTPPEVLRFLVMRVDPPKHIDFDPGLGLLNLVDEYDRYEELFFGTRSEEKDPEEKKRIYQLSSVSPGELDETVSWRQVPYRHLVSLVQIDPTMEEVMARLKRTEGIVDMSDRERHNLENRLKCARFWLDNFAPEVVRFSVKEQFEPEMIRGYGKAEEEITEELLKELSIVEWKAENIHQAFYDVKERLGISPKRVFTPVYRLLLGQNRGPRLGYFLSSFTRDLVIHRLREALSALKEE